MLGANKSGICLICSGLISKVSGNFLFKVKYGPFGLVNCYAVNVLSRDVTGGNLSTDFPVILATQYVILILLSSNIKFCNYVKSYLS